MPRVDRGWFLAFAVAMMFGFSTSVAMWRGTQHIVGRALSDRKPEYSMDLRRVARIGVRAFVDDYPSVIPRLKSIHSQTHPPGPLLLLAGLARVWPRHLAARALCIALLAALVLVPTWFFARIVAGERAAFYAVLLLAVAPGPVISAFTWLDSVFATVLMTSTALFVRAVAGHERPWRAVLAGAALGLSTLMTYAAALVAAFGALYALLVLPLRQASKVLAVTSAGCLAAIGGLWAILGFDLLGSYLSFRWSARYSEFLLQRSYAYWLFANWAVWLVYAGLPSAALGMRALVAERPRHLVASLIPLAILAALPAEVSGLLPGETERTWLFAMPVLATSAGATLARWERTYGQRAWIIAALVTTSAAQTIILRALYVNR
jgi:hypothetical protein